MRTLIELTLQRIWLTSQPEERGALQVGGAVATARVAEDVGNEQVLGGMNTMTPVLAQLAQGSHVASRRSAQKMGPCRSVRGPRRRRQITVWLTLKAACA